MKMEILLVRDILTNTFSRPVFVANTKVALRDFTNQVNSNDDNNPLRNNPDQFEIWHRGNFDDHSGEFEITEMNRLCHVKELKSNDNPLARVLAAVREELETAGHTNTGLRQINTALTKDLNQLKYQLDQAKTELLAMRVQLESHNDETH